MDLLIEQYKKGNLILFIGAGVSVNLGLPSWGSLIQEVAKQLGYDYDVLKTYGDYLALAEYYKIKKGSIGPLRSWMDREFHRPSIKIENSEIHQLIAKGNFPRIYTTNYDRWLEKAHDHYSIDYTKISNVSDFIKAKSNVRQIVKFHGDFDDDSSIVFSESSYYERLDFETPMDLKLRGDLLGTCVLFIGYSLSDMNIRILFYKLAKLWKSYGGTFEQPDSYIFSSKPNPVQAQILEKWGINMLSSDEDDPGVALEEFLRKVVS